MNVKLQTKQIKGNNWLTSNHQVKQLCSSILFLFNVQYSFGFNQQKNDLGIIDLQRITIKENTEIALDTDLEFYWHQLLQPGEFNKKKPFAIVSFKNWT
jgi:hypothetical protein